MKHIGVLKSDQWITILNIIGIPVFASYFISMFVIPFVVGKGSFIYVQGVWHHWQSLNVGMLAFISSLLAFNISKYNAIRQREREFVAARAFLPEALSELTSYFQACSPMLKEAWSRVGNHSDRCITPLKESLPDLPVSYRDVFSRCIITAEPDVSEHLAYILTRLQIHHSRLQDLQQNFSEDSKGSPTSENIMAYIYCLGELQALVNKTYEFARGTAFFDNSPLDIKQFSSAYLGLEISADLFGDLWRFTERAVERNAVTSTL